MLPHMSSACPLVQQLLTRHLHPAARAANSLKEIESLPKVPMFNRKHPPTCHAILTEHPPDLLRRDHAVSVFNDNLKNLSSFPTGFQITLKPGIRAKDGRLFVNSLIPKYTTLMNHATTCDKHAPWIQPLPTYRNDTTRNERTQSSPNGDKA